MRRFANENTNNTFSALYLYEDEAREAAESEPNFDYLGETMLNYESFNTIESDVPDFSGEANCYVAYDKDGNELGIFGYWDVRENEE